jgi:TatD DNase family protein
MIAACPLVDTHAHPMDPGLESDLPALLGRAREAGVAAIVCVGYDLASSQAAVELARREAMCFAAVGIHPNYVSAAKDTDLYAVEQLAAEPKVVAIGETGLDYFRQFSDAAAQREWFRAHLVLATRLSLPVVVHNRDASDDTVAILNDWRGTLSDEQPVGVLHCFSGDLELMKSAAANNMLVSFAGPVTFKNARALPDVARAVSADGYVVETDSPYLSPHPYRGATNEPARVRLVAEKLAELRDISLEQVALETSTNALQLFPALREQVRLPGLSA